MNTSVAPASSPGSVSGRYTRKKARTGCAPMVSAAGISAGSPRAMAAARRHCRNTDPLLRADPSHRSVRPAAAAARRATASLSSVEASSMMRTRTSTPAWSSSAPLRASCR